MSEDHYELLGVQPDATKDEIKAAYRAEIENADSGQRAQLNRAWNVLSDPIQRQRYDATRSEDGAEESAEDGAEDAALAVPARRITGARRAAQTADAGGGGSNGSSGNGSGGDGSGDERPGRRALPPTVSLPDDLVMADPKSRSLAMLFDFSVLLVIFFLVVQYGGTAFLENRYPKETARVETLNEQVKDANEEKDRADDAQDDADDALAAAKQNGDRADVEGAQAKADAAEARAEAADAKVESLSEDLFDAQAELQPMFLLLYGIVLVLALAYTVPMSARSGQTLGKRLRKVRLVRVDGSSPGWSASLVHYGVPIVLTLALWGFLRELAVIVALGAVLWNIRDRNRQGVHDKLAKTFVVQA